jgi:fructose-bisphosphate aldolase, class I
MSAGEMNTAQLERMRSGQGFVAALDQSGGSTPKALGLYGIDKDQYSSDEEMFDLVHQMRARIITSPSFTSERILAAILFEMTMDRDIEGKGTAQFLWEDKGIVPILKVDLGLMDAEHGVQMMKPMPELDDLLSRAQTHQVFGTKMRSVIHDANPDGVRSIVSQQFEVAMQILFRGLVPIIEPEVDIKSSDKRGAEQMLKDELMAALDRVPSDQQVMFKLTIPEEDNFYLDFVEHPRVLRVVALSGGYSREEANARLARHDGLIASFSRALTEGLTAQQSEEEFDAALDTSIQDIFTASTVKSR